MSKEEYADEIKRLTYHYQSGVIDERKRIIKVINDKIKYYGLDKKMLTDFGRGFHAALEELQKDIA